MQRIVLDTNVLVNGVQDDLSYAYRIIQNVIHGELEGVASTAILQEYEHMATRLITDEEYLDMLDDYYDRLVIINPRKHYRLSDDPSDNKFLDAAVEGEAQFIISNDAHLLDLGDVDGVRIVTPEHFLHSTDDGEEWQSMVQMIGISR